MVPYDQRRELDADRALHVAREEFYKPGDGCWSPGGLRGTALTAGLKRRCEEQMSKVVRDPWLCRSVKGAVKGHPQRHAEVVIESLLSTTFNPGVLLYGTVRRLAERWR